MALQGTIGDFGLADIFQLIGIQRKSGLLSMENDREKVVITFSEGNVVGADNVGVKIEDLLGSVLVRTGRLTQAQLDEALAIQRKTLQRLGYILLDRNFISEEDLRESLQTQVEQIVYRLFRWLEGKYAFDAPDHIQFDPNLTPIGAETILMEGARMVDEWPIIERRIPNDRVVVRKTAAAARLDGGPVLSVVDEGVELDLVAGSVQDDGAEEITLSPEEGAILRLIDGEPTVQQISDRSTLGEFDTYRILAELLTRNLIEKVEVAQETPGTVQVDRGGKVASWLLLVVVLAAAGIGAATVASNPYTPWAVASSSEDTERLRTFASRGRLERIERSLRLFFLDTGQFPDRLELLADNGYLAPGDLLDPWGRPYAYRLDTASYSLSGSDADGADRPDLSLTRPLSAVQRRLVEQRLDLAR